MESSAALLFKWFLPRKIVKSHGSCHIPDILTSKNLTWICFFKNARQHRSNLSSCTRSQRHGLYNQTCWRSTHSLLEVVSEVPSLDVTDKTLQFTTKVAYNRVQFMVLSLIFAKNWKGSSSHIEPSEERTAHAGRCVRT